MQAVLVGLVHLEVEPPSSPLLRLVDLAMMEEGCKEAVVALVALEALLMEARAIRIRP
jgi:cystathionine beta-lyase/cystathionine gamma-synthase